MTPNPPPQSPREKPRPGRYDELATDAECTCERCSSYRPGYPQQEGDPCGRCGYPGPETRRFENEESPPPTAAPERELLYREAHTGAFVYRGPAAPTPEAESLSDDEWATLASIEYTPGSRPLVKHQEHLRLLLKAAPVLLAMRESRDGWRHDYAALRARVAELEAKLTEWEKLGPKLVEQRDTVIKQREKAEAKLAEVTRERDSWNARLREELHREQHLHNNATRLAHDKNDALSAATAEVARLREELDRAIRVRASTAALNHAVRLDVAQECLDIVRQCHEEERLPLWAAQQISERFALAPDSPTTGKDGR